MNQVHSFSARTTRANTKTLIRNNILTAILLSIITHYLSLNDIFIASLSYAGANFLALVTYKLKWQKLAGYLAIYSILFFSLISSYKTGALKSPFIMWLVPIPLLAAIIQGVVPTFGSMAISMVGIFVLTFFSLSQTEVNELDQSAYALLIIMFISLLVVLFQLVVFGISLAKNLKSASERIESAAESRKKLLDALHEGVFFIDSKGGLSQERSASLKKLIPLSETYKTAFDFFQNIGEKKEADIKLVLDLLFEDDDSGFMSDFGTTITMLPSEVKLDQKYLKIIYHPINNEDNKLEQVLVMVEDITIQKEEQAKIMKQKSSILRLSKAAKDTDSYLNFFDDASKIVSQIDSAANGDLNKPEYLRLIHTLKGNVSVYDFKELGEMIHELETSIIDDGKKKIPNLWQTVRNLWRDQTQEISISLNLEKQRDYYTLPKVKVDALEKAVNSNSDCTTLAEHICQLHRNSLDILFVKYSDYLEKILNQFPNKSVVIEYAKDSEDLSHDELALFDEAIVHIIRNCLDHGIESKAVRLEKNKDEKGVITVGFYREEDGILKLDIQDNGGGIKGDILAEKAVKNGLWSSEESAKSSWQDKIDLIFNPGLSSSEEVTSISGRGVGMDAVKVYLESQGGGVRISSEVGHGSSFSLFLNKKIAKKSSMVA